MEIYENLMANISQTYLYITNHFYKQLHDEKTHTVFVVFLNSSFATQTAMDSLNRSFTYLSVVRRLGIYKTSMFPSVNRFFFTQCNVF